MACASKRCYLGTLLLRGARGVVPPLGQAGSPAPSRSGHSSSPCKRRSGRKARSGGQPRRGAPIPGAPHRRGWRDKGAPSRALPSTPGFEAVTIQKPWQENAPRAPRCYGGMVGWGGERSPRSHAPARRPRTSCVCVPGSWLKFPLLLPPAKRARPLARAGPKPGRPPWPPGLVRPPTYEPTASAPILGHAPSTDAGARPLYLYDARSGIPTPSARAVPRGRRRL